MLPLPKDSWSSVLLVRFNGLSIFGLSATADLSAVKVESLLLSAGLGGCTTGLGGCTAELSAVKVESLLLSAGLGGGTVNCSGEVL